MSSPTGFIPYDTQGVKYVTSIPSKPDPDFVYMLWDGVDSSKAVRYEFSDGELQSDGVVETTLANLDSAQSAGVGAELIVSEFGEIIKNGTEGPINISRQLHTNRIASKCLTGRTKALALSDATFPANSNTNGLTQYYRIGLAAGFDAVRILIPNTHTSAISGVKAQLGIPSAVGALSSVASTNSATSTSSAAPAANTPVTTSGGAWMDVNVSGNPSISLPSAVDAANMVPSYTASDWMPVSSVNRTDSTGFSNALLDIKLFIPAGSTATMAYNGATYSAWALSAREDFTLGKVHRVWAIDADCIANAALMTSTTVVPYHTPIIVQYRSKQKVISMVVNGDSIYEGSAGVTKTLLDGHNWIAHQTMQSDLGIPVELCMLTVPGGNVLQLTEKMQQLTKYIDPSVYVLESNSVNGYGTTLGTRTNQHGFGSIGCQMAALYDKKTAFVVGTMLPVTNTSVAWGASDSYRTTFNAQVIANASLHGYIVSDDSAAISGNTVNSQIEPAAVYISADGKHPNDAGQLAMANTRADACKLALLAYGR